MDQIVAEPPFRALVRKAVTIKGSQASLAAAIRRSQQQVSALCNRADAISAEDALAIDLATEGQVGKSELRPDLWPPEQASPPLAAEQVTA